MNSNEAVSYLVRKYPLLSDDRAYHDFEDDQDMSLFEQTWIGLMADGMRVRSLYWKNKDRTVGEMWVETWAHRRIACLYVGCMFRNCDGTLRYWPGAPNVLATHKQRLRREVIRQRLEHLIRATISPESSLARVKRHRLFDRNILISVLPLYLNV